MVVILIHSLILLFYLLRCLLLEVWYFLLFTVSGIFLLNLNYFHVFSLNAYARLIFIHQTTACRLYRLIIEQALELVL